MRLLELAVCAFAIYVASERPAPAPAPAPIVQVVTPPAIVVSPPPPPPPAQERIVSIAPLGAPPPEPSDAARAAALDEQCAHADPRRTKAAVLALAAVATGACTPAPYESGSDALALCGQSFLDVYTVIACGRCLTYRWVEGAGWSLDEMHLAANGQCD